jgi:hypothetical protein
MLDRPTVAIAVVATTVCFVLGGWVWATGVLIAVALAVAIREVWPDAPWPIPGTIAAVIATVWTIATSSIT